MLLLFMKLKERYLRKSMIKKLFYFCLFYLFACSNQAFQPTPEWVFSSNSNDDYWIGVGIVEKPFMGNVREAARSEALNEIASQISVNISSSFSNVLTENNLNINQFSKSMINTRINNNRRWQT